MAWHCCPKLRKKTKVVDDPLWNTTGIDDLLDMEDMDDLTYDRNRSAGIIVTNNKRRKHKHHHGNNREKRGIKQLMYQIPVRRSSLDRDYLIYAGYRVQTPQELSAQILRTDVGVDFSEDQPRRRAYTDGGIPLVRPKAYTDIPLVRARGVSKISNMQYGDGGQAKRDYTRERSHPSWQRGDRVFLTDSNEIVEILDRGLKDRELVVKIQYLDKSESPGFVVEVPLLELMTTGNLVQAGTGTGRPVGRPIKVDVKTMTNRLSSPQPYYRKYSKPVIVAGLLQSCFGGHSQSEDTTDARSCDTPRFRPLSHPWYSPIHRKDSHLSLSKLLNDPEEFQRKRLFFENFYIATERGLKPKPYTVPPALDYLDNYPGDGDEVDDGGQGGSDSCGEDEEWNGGLFPEQPSFVSQAPTENELYVTCVAYLTMNQEIAEGERAGDQSDENGEGDGKGAAEAGQHQVENGAFDENIGGGEVNFGEDEEGGVQSDENGGGEGDGAMDAGQHQVENGIPDENIGVGELNGDIAEVNVETHIPILEPEASGQEILSSSPPSLTSVDPLVAAVSPKRHSEVRSPSPILEEEEEGDDDWTENQEEVTHAHQQEQEPAGGLGSQEDDDWGVTPNAVQQEDNSKQGSGVIHNVTFTKE